MLQNLFEIFLMNSIRLHYNMNYALHLFENCWDSPKPTIIHPAKTNDGGLPLSCVEKTAYALTHEQSRIVNHQIEDNDVNLNFVG